MIIAIDTETEGLDARKFILGCVYDGRRPRFFDEKSSMWDFILSLGAREKARGHNLYVYSHNHEFDMYSYGDYSSKSLRYVSFNPFICFYSDSPSDPKTRPYIYFLDTVALSRSPLSDIGSVIGLPKLDPPPEIKEGLSKSSLDEDIFLKNRVKSYCFRDTQIVYDYVKFLKSRLLSDGIHIRSLFSIPQIAVNYLAQYISRDAGLSDCFFENKKTWEFYETKNKDEISRSYRGGTIRPFNVGSFSGCSLIDVNSLYPYALSQIKIPYLSSERKIRNVSDISHYFGKIGVAKALLRKPKDIGSIGIRYKGNLSFPQQSCLLLGTYTFLEIEEFLRRGYEVLAVEYVVCYDSSPYTLSSFVHKLYSLRKRSNFDNSFYKSVMNYLLGKLAQKKESFELVFEDLYNKSEMFEQGFSLSDFSSGIGAFRKSVGVRYNKFFCPIIPAYATAFSRLFLLRHLEKFSPGQLLYTDTDSILFTGSLPDGISLSDSLGSWKLEDQDADSRIYCKKAYRIRDKIKLSGVSKSQLPSCSSERIKLFDGGKIFHKRMVGMRRDLQSAGSFEDISVDLDDSSSNYSKYINSLSNESLIIDDYESDISYFLPHLKKANV